MNTTSNAAPVELSVVIPVYDERERLPATLAAVRAALERSGSRWEVLVCDDGSRDGTAALAHAAARRDPRVRVLRSPVNRGKGHAVRRGVLASRGRLVLVTDADLATPLAELARLRAALGQGYAAAIGSRARLPRAKGGSGADPRPALRRLPARFGALVIRRAAVRGFADTQCGFKLFEGGRARAAFARARVNGWGFDAEILRLFAARGWPVAEVPVRWTHRPGSKLRPADYLRVLGEVAVIRLRYGPPGPPPTVPRTSSCGPPPALRVPA
ncbi:dolichyl-phosphate beta-glucosyltransferase [Spirillospora sp. NPDC050679]